MKTISKILAYAICLQLTVGAYPVQSHFAYAQDDRTENNADRSPAQQDNNLSMSAEEAVVNCKNYKEQFENQCRNAKGEVARDRAFIHDKEISGDEPRFYNCDAAAEVIEKVIGPFMDKVVAIVKEQKEDPNCTDCGLKNKSVGEVIGSGLDAEALAAPTPACSIADQKKFAKDADQCSFACNLGLQTKGCPASSGIGAMCVVELGKGILKAIKDILLFPFVLAKDIAQWSWKKIAGDNENETTNKALAHSGWSNKEIEEIKSDPKKAEAGLLARAGTFFKEFGKAVIGYPEYEMKGKCTDCAGKADLMCGVIGNGAGFLATIFGNGFVFGAAKGAATKLASKLVSVSKGSSKFAKFTAKSIKTAEKSVDVTKKSLKFVGTYTGVIPLGNLIIKGASKLGGKSVAWWTSFKGSKTYTSIKKSWVHKNLISKTSIPGKITLKAGRTVASGFKKMGAFEDRMFLKGVNLTNKELGSKMLRAQTINALRVAKAENKAGEARKVELVVGHDNVLVVKTEQGKKTLKWKDLDAGKVVSATSHQDGRFIFLENKDGTTTIYDAVFKKPLKTVKIAPEEAASVADDLANATKNVADDAEKTSAATEEAIRDVNELVVVKDASEARSVQDWNDLKKATSNKLQGVKMKHLDDVENIRPVTFSSEAFNDGKKIENIVVAETSQGPRQIKGVNMNEIKTNGVHEYQDGKLLLVEKNDGSYLIHDVENGKHITQASKGSEELEAILGRETKKYGGSLDDMSYEQVKTNLRINGTKYTEEVDAVGAKTLKIETPNGCTPKTLSFGVSKAN